MSDPTPEPDASSVTPSGDTLLSDFGFSAEDFAFLAEHPEEFAPAGRTSRFTIGQRNSFTGSVNGHDVECVALIKRMVLNRVSLTQQTSQRDEHEYQTITGTMNPVDAYWAVILKGKDSKEREFPLQEYLRQMVNVGRPTDPFNPERFSEILRNVGMNLDGGPMVLLWQHMGVDESKAAAFLEFCQSQGAQQTVQNMADAGRIQSILEFGRGKGLDVVQFELGMRVDRGESRTGQGFQDPIDSIVMNLRRSVAMRSQVSKLRKELEEKSGEMDEDAIEAAQTRINNLSRTARSYTNNIAGAQESIEVDDSGDAVKMVPTGQWYPVSAPIGRFTVAFTEGGERKEEVIDLWKPRSEGGIDAPVNIDPSLLVDTTQDALAVQGDGSDEEPF